MIDINWSYFLHVKSSNKILLSIIIKYDCWLIFLSHLSHIFIYHTFSCWLILLFFLIFLVNLSYYFILFSLQIHLIILSYFSCISWNSIKYHFLQISVSCWNDFFKQKFINNSEKNIYLHQIFINFRNWKIIQKYYLSIINSNTLWAFLIRTEHI